MTHDLPHAPGESYAERLANALAALHSRIGHSGGDTSEAERPPDEEVLSGDDSDRRADREENRRWRGLP